MSLRMTPIVGCVMMVEMYCAVTSVPGCSTYSAQGCRSPQRRKTMSGSAPYARYASHGWLGGHVTTHAHSWLHLVGKPISQIMVDMSALRFTW